ncbi:hypothetical protein N9S62_01545 [Pelagibacteraceae bacterium]|nr:hypothetical protein [Pelagibacteraceae bacterium]
MKKQILLVITSQNLSNHLYKRLGVGINYNNYQIVYWNLLPLINKSLSKEKSKKIRKKNYINISTISMLQKEIQFLPNKFFYWNTCGYTFLSSIIDRYLSFIGGKKIYIESGTQPDYSKEVKKSYINYLKIHYKTNKYWLLNKIKSKIFTTIKNFISKKMIIPTTNIYFATNEKTFSYYKKISNGKQVFKIDACEMVNFKEFKKIKNKNKKSIVFIDQELENPFDQRLNYGYAGTNYKKEDYWSKLDILFDKISKSLNNFKVNIAAHPRRKKNNLPSKRKFTFNKTLQLISDSKLVLGHHSLAVHYAILLRKPILFIYSSKQIRIGEIIGIKRLAKETGSMTLDFGSIDKKKIKINLKKILKINVRKYKNYEKNYICYQNQTSYGRWKTILKNLIAVQ